MNLGLKFNNVGLEHWRLGSDRAFARNHYHAFAEEGLTLRRGKTFHRGLTTIVGA